MIHNIVVGTLVRITIKSHINNHQWSTILVSKSQFSSKLKFQSHICVWQLNGASVAASQVYLERNPFSVKMDSPYHRRSKGGTYRSEREWNTVLEDQNSRGNLNYSDMKTREKNFKKSVNCSMYLEGKCAYFSSVRRIRSCSETTTTKTSFTVSSL